MTTYGNAKHMWGVLNRRNGTTLSQRLPEVAWLVIKNGQVLGRTVRYAHTQDLLLEHLLHSSQNVLV